MSEQILDKLSLLGADGESLEGYDVRLENEEGSSARNLAGLAALRDLFRSRAAGVAAAEPQCPFNWGRLVAVEVIGVGGFSRVYRAHDPDLDRDVALKLFRRDAEGLNADHLIAEARRHAQVHHPRVLAIHGAGVEAGVAGLWTDLLQGKTLADRIGAKGPLAPAEIIRLAKDLAAGLNAVHEQGIAHGDLKAANVLIDAHGRAIVMDFGAAQATADGAPVKFGSPATMAPELFDGLPASPASDSWALGAVLYQAATGTLPLTGQTYDTIRKAHRSGKIDFAALPSSLDAKLTTLIRRLLSASPAARPSAAATAEAIHQIEAAPQLRFRRRALGAVLVSLLGGLTLSLWFLLEARQAQSEAERQLARAEETADLLLAIIDRPRATRDGTGVTIAEGIRAILPQIDDVLLDDPVGRAELLTHLAHTVLQIENQEQAGVWLDEALILFRQNNDHSEAFRYARRVRATILARQARFDEAAALLEEDGPLVLHDDATESDLLDAFLLSMVLTHVTDGARGLPLAERAHALADQVEFLGVPESRLRGHEALARQYRRAGDLVAEEKTLRDGMAWAEDNMLSRHNDLRLQLQEALAQTLIEQGNFAQAQPLVEQALAIYEDWLGSDSYDAFRLRNLKGVLLTNMGRYAEAVTFLKPVYSGIDANPRLSASARIEVGNNLANALKEIGQPKEALAIYLETRSRILESTGPEHPWAAMIGSNLAEVYLDLHRWEDALDVAHDTLALDVRLFGENHLFTGHARMMKGAALSHLGRAEEGEALIRQSALFIEQSFGQSSPHYVQSQLKLAESLIIQNKPEQAKHLIREALHRAREALSEDHAWVRGLEALLADTR